MNQQPVRIGVIGAGKNSQKNHLPALQRLARERACSLQALCDLNLDIAKRVAEEFGFESYTSKAEEICERDDVDAVFICGTVQMHKEYTLRALERGKHVFVEKPPAPSISDLQQALILARLKGRIVCVGFNRRFYASINHMKRLIGTPSEIKSLEGIYHKPFYNESYMHGSSSWITYSSIHGVDAMCYVMEEPPEKLFSVHNHASGDVPQNLSALLIWKNGCHGVFSSNNSTGSRLERYTIHTPGSSYSATEIDLTMLTGSDESLTHFDEGNSETRGFYGEHREFLDAIQKETVPRHGLPQALVVMHLLSLMEQGFCGTIDWSPILRELSFEKEEEKPEMIVSGSPGNVQKAKGKSLLILNPLALQASLPRLARKYTLVYEEEVSRLSSENRRDIVGVITGTGGTPVSTKLLDALPSLAVVGVVGASVKKYNPEEILRRHIPILNASDIYAEAVAEFALMQALIGIKYASRSHDVMRAKLWGATAENRREKLIKFLRHFALLPLLSPFRFLMRPLGKSLTALAQLSGAQAKGAKARGGSNLKGMTVGIIGYGEIAKKFILLLQNFECDIKVCSDYLTLEEAHVLGVKKVGLAEALSAPVVSLHRGLSERTRHAFGRHEISLLRPGAVFINTARGELIDEEALIERLKRGDIFACLDVFSKEPLPKRSVLRELPNVFLTSHLAGATKQTYAHSADVVADRVIDYLEGKTPESRIIASLDLLANMS
jgi:phosphoglycerate dehydrogenase-like enzyme/predicted dehydrogenase